MRRDPTAHKVTRAITRLYRVDPFLSEIAAGWNVRPEIAHTTATDGPGFFYSPQWVQEMPQATVDWATHHEALHVRLGHHWRLAAGDYDPQLFNLAADLAVNSILMPPDCERFPMPGHGQFSHLPRGKSCEWYYGALKPPEPEQEPDDGEQDEPTDQAGDQDATDGAQEPGGESGDQEDPDEGDEPTDATDGSDDSDSDADPGDDTSDDDDGNGNADQADDDEPGQPDGKDSGADDADGQADDTDADGSATDGPQADGQSNDPAGQIDRNPTWSPIGQVLPAPGDPKTAEMEWTVQTAEAIERERQHGTLPGYAVTMAADIYAEPPLDPRPLIRRFMTQHVKDGYSFRRPHRRRRVPGIILPGRLSANAGHVFEVVDSSGSMADGDCAQSQRMLEGVLLAFPRATVTLAQCDVRVIEEATRTFTRADFPLNTRDIRWQGRGGTSLAPAMAMAAQLRPRPDVIVVVSDMVWNVAECPNPGIPTLWLDVSGASERNEIYRPTFGKVVILRDWLDRKAAGRAA